MQKVRLLNTSEYMTEQTLRKVLDSTKFRIFAQLPLGKVIKLEPNETIPKDEKNSLQCIIRRMSLLFTTIPGPHCESLPPPWGVLLERLNLPRLLI